MNKKQLKTLAAIYSSPTPRNIAFRELHSLLVANDCTVIQREGSRIDFVHGKTTLHLHEPHPGKEIKPYQVKAARDFLLNIGVTP